MKKVDILWTGGWDSTYRVLLASMVEGLEVKPHYIIDVERRSSLRELKAISDVRRELSKIDPLSSRRIKALQITPISEIKPNEEVSQAYSRLKEKAHLGSQYDWLSRYAKMNGINNLELSVHVDDKAYHFLEGRVERIEGGGGWRLKESVQGDVSIFSCFNFPLLMMKKTSMREKAEEFGFINALEKSWFCFNPIGDSPCGICNPCVYTIEEGMSYRLTKVAMLRYKTRFLRKVVKSPVRLLSKIYNRALG